MRYRSTSLIASPFGRAKGWRRVCDGVVINAAPFKLWEEPFGIHALPFATALAYEQTRYFFCVVPSAADEGAPGTGKSELNMSALTFHLPSACFFQTSQYLPLSSVPSFIVIS